MQLLAHLLHPIPPTTLHITLGLLALASLSSCGGDDPVPAATNSPAMLDGGVTDPTEATPIPASQTAPSAPSSTESRCNPLSADLIQTYADEVAAFFAQNRASLNVLSTSISSLGTLVDWIDPKTQTADQQLASPPTTQDTPDVTDPARTALESDILNSLLSATSNLVPILRIDGVTQFFQSWKCMSLVDVLSKYGDAKDMTPPPKEPRGAEGGPDTDWAHHYATTSQTGTIYGTSAILRIPNPFVWRSDEFSLGQVALTHGSDTSLQTIEVGWQKYPNLYPDGLPHLFTYYTTTGYHSHGNNLGGYNRSVTGWVQVSKTVSPGDALVSGNEMAVRIRIHQGNWWIAINNEWAGYYPAKLFSPTGLGTAGDSMSWYGEVIDYRLDNVASFTQMGNGQFAGLTSSYIRNIMSESLDATFFYTPTYVNADKPNCYTIDNHPGSSTAWGSYFFFGGPGKGSPSCL